ncbi:MAG: asparagine synthase (glutamine-hydrolyzing) [Bacteroidetes bacterium]|nr:asparagine synthase (glutamine-hydrolyzing) [Bacteroidota bacterium]
MCGIAGFFSVSQRFSEPELQVMTDSLAHRGPNASGYFRDAIVGLGHRRLSVIDLSDNASQPMHSADKRYVMVYNGEVYNYREIATELKLKYKTNFRSASDSEAILEAYVQYGPEFVQKLNGMFAIVIYDKLKNELFICRDRLGIKPLYYYWDGTNFAFASELKALKKLTSIPLEINELAISQFLHLGFIPAPNSIYKSIYKLEAGSMLQISKNGLDHQKFWSVKSKITRDVITNEKKALVLLSDLMMSSIQYQLKSDVPFGVFLSGGIDSSLVTAQACNLSNVKVNTFSIGFDENRFNESDYAKAIAKYLGTSHHEFIVHYSDAMNLIDDVFEAYDEPFGDSSAIPTMLVSKLAKQYVTVTLSGEGGDELFFGYGAYKWANRLNNIFLKTAREPISKVLASFNNRYRRASKLFEYSKSDNINSHIFSQEQYLFSNQELDALLEKKYNDAKSDIFSLAALSDKRSLRANEKQALFDIEYYLPYDLLTKVDRASMRYSLETRVPYLDHRIVEFALNLSPNLKHKNGVSKYLLKEILFQYVPESYFNRPKQGFAIPLEKWLKNELSFLIHDFLNEKIVSHYGVVKYEEVDRLKKMFHSGHDYLYNRIWLLIVLHKWLVKNA